MPLIPITYIPATLILFYVAKRVSDRKENPENPFYLGFLIAVALVLVVIGSRFGYEMAYLKSWQPIIAAIIPPMAYLAFCDIEQLIKKEKWKMGLPGLSVIIIKTIMIYYPQLIDFSLALNGYFYGYLLIRQGLLGQDGLNWKELDQSKHALIILWSEVAYLLVSATVDLIIAYDFWKNNGQNLETIVGRVPLVIAIIAIVVLLIRKNEKARSKKQRENTPLSGGFRLDKKSKQEEEETFLIIERFVEQSRCYLDPNLSINRIARKVGIPGRKVSEAINHQTGESVSVFINRYRIEFAKERLKRDESNIIEIMYQSGFNTKSNFNKEFKRITGEAPGAWRDRYGK